MVGTAQQRLCPPYFFHAAFVRTSDHRNAVDLDIERAGPFRNADEDAGRRGQPDIGKRLHDTIVIEVYA